MRTWIIETPEQMQRVSLYLPRVPLDRPKHLALDDYREPRSLKQNARLWLLHTAAAEAVGTSPEQMHEDMLCEYFGYTETKLPSGRITRQPNKRSSGRDKKEFALFMTFVETFYIDKLGVWLQ